MSNKDVLLVMKGSAAKATEGNPLFSKANDQGDYKGCLLYFWKSAEWLESSGTPEFELVMALNRIEVDPNDFLLLRTWGSDAVDVTGCFWSNPFKVRVVKNIAYDRALAGE